MIDIRELNMQYRIKTRRRNFAAALTLVFLLSASCLTPRFARAADLGEIKVAVTDRHSGAPLPLARVEIYGPRSLRGITDVGGNVAFERLPPGVYEIEVDARGHRHLTISASRLGIAQHLSLNASLAVSPLVIATVTASRRNNTATLSSVTENSAAGTIDHSVASALGTLAGITINTGNGFNEYPSIAGHYPSQTRLVINGAPVSALGATANLALFDLDLFDSAQLDSSSVNGSSGGSINFSSRDPTLDWLGSAQGTEGSYGTASSTFFEGGTSGRVGISYTHATHDRGSSLDGLSFLDTSGVFYSHDAIARTVGDALKIRYPFSVNNVMTLSQVRLVSKLPLICNQFTGPVPCGFGPVNTATTHLSSTSLNDFASLGAADISLALFHNRQSDNVDQSGRYIDGVLSPQTSTSVSTTDGFKLHALYRLSVQRVVAIDLSSIIQKASSAGSAYGTYVTPAVSSAGFSSVSIGTPILASGRFTSDVRFGFQRNGSSSQADAGASLSYRPTGAILALPAEPIRGIRTKMHFKNPFRSVPLNDSTLTGSHRRRWRRRRASVLTDVGA